MDNINRLKSLFKAARSFVKGANTPKRPNGVPITAAWDGKQKMWVSGSIDNEKQVGKWKWWRRTGELHTEIAYNEEGERHGVYKIYHLDGAVYDQGFYINGKRKGKRTVQKTNGRSDLNFGNNMHWSVWKMEYEYQDGELLSAKCLNRRGSLVAAKPNNVPEGAYFTRNSEWQHGSMNGNKMIGEWKGWSNAGRLLWVGNYNSNGRLDGNYKRYHEDGDLAHDGIYSNGQLNGTITYYRIKKGYSRASFPYEAKKEVKKVIATYRNGNQTGAQYFDENMEVCNRHGNPIPKNQINSAFLGSASTFIDTGLETYLTTTFGKKQTFDIAEKKRKFQELWGVSLPDDLSNAIEAFANSDYPEFMSWETHPLRFGGMEDEDLNIVEHAILTYQREFPADNFIDWMTGTVCLDRLVNTRGYYGNESYQYGLYDKTHNNLSTNQIYKYEHRNPNSSWGNEVNNAAAKDLSSLIFMLAGADAYEHKSLINANTFTQVFNKSKSITNFGYNTMNQVMLNGQNIRYYDFRYQSSKRLPQTYFQRSKWLIELLRFNYETFNPRIYPHKNYNKKLKPTNYKNEIPKIQTVVPEALYWLFRTFFFNENAYLNDYIAAANDSSSRIIRDAAALVTELKDGREELGEIQNVHQFRKQYL